MSESYRYDSKKAAEADLKGRIENAVSKIRRRALALGGDLVVNGKTYSILPWNKVELWVNDNFSEKQIKGLGLWHSQQLAFSHTETKGLKESVFHAELAYKYRGHAEDGNNLGYLYLAKGNHKKARSLFKEAKRKCEKLNDSLPLYNLGVLEAKEGNLTKSLWLFRNSIKHLKASKGERSMLCLFLPKLEGNKLTFPEVMNPDLLSSARKAVTVIKKLLSVGGK